MREFSAIDALVAQQQVRRDDVICGIGDDAAVLAVRLDAQLVVTMDTVVAGVHYPLDTAASDVGFKLLAVNLSDLAAMGAEPAWATLAMSMPSIEEDWLQAFMSGFYQLAQAYNVQLIGGDTTRAPLPVLTVQMHGWIPSACRPLRRDGARVGDRICVSGTLGDAALALAVMGLPVEAAVQNEWCALRQRLDRPTPRVQLGCALRGVASSCIDVSDGLLADLGHVLRCSDVGGIIDLGRVPFSRAFVHVSQMYQPLLEKAGPGVPSAQMLALTGGDDYELCFTVAPEKAAMLEEIAVRTGVLITEIGEITANPGLWIRTAEGVHRVEPHGFEHF